MHQNFNLLLWENGEPSQHTHWLSYAVEVESSFPTGTSLSGEKNVILNADLILCFWGCRLAEAAGSECVLLYLLWAVCWKGMFF